MSIRFVRSRQKEQAQEYILSFPYNVTPGGQVRNEFPGWTSDSVRYPSRQCQILDFAQVVAFWRDGRYCNARGGTVDKPWRTVEFQARVKILGPLENWLATASYDAPAEVGSGEACATVDQVVLAGRATNQ